MVTRLDIYRLDTADTEYEFGIGNLNLSNLVGSTKPQPQHQSLL